MASEYTYGSDTRPAAEPGERPRPIRPAAPDVELLREVQRGAGNQATQRLLAARRRVLQREITAPRFKGEPVLDAIDKGTRVFTRERAEQDGKEPGVPRAVRIVQQALRDLVGRVDVTGSYDAATAVVVHGLNKKRTDAFDQASLNRLDAVMATHELDKRLAKSGREDGRAISAEEREDVNVTLLPPVPRDERTGEIIQFDPANKGAYQGELRDALEDIVTRLGAGLSEKSAARSAETVQSWDSIEKVGREAKRATDAVFGKYSQQPPLVRGTHLTDRWDEITASLKTMNPPQLGEVSAQVALKYLRNSQKVTALNHRFGVRLGEPAHMTSLIEPVVQAVADAHRDEWLEMHRHQPGSAKPGTGQVKIQRAKSDDPDKDAWAAFATLVHEYIHTLAPVGYYAWVDKLDAERRFTLTEGITDAFTRVVLEQLDDPWAGLKNRYAPGPYRGTYAAAADRAEQVIGRIGILNAYNGYFKAQVGLLGVTPDDRV
jgi:hypothetical protein